MPSFDKPHERELVDTADLIAEDSSNVFLKDAAGYLRVTHDMVTQDQELASVLRTADAAMDVVGGYAAASDNVELADYVFERVNLASKWRLYGIAAVAGTVYRHPDWSLWATTDETLEGTDQNQVAKVAMLVAQTKIALADYNVAGATEASREKVLSTAVLHKQQALATVDRRTAKEYKTRLTFGETDDYKTELDSLFAEKGLWWEVNSPDPQYPLSAVVRGNQLTAKAAVGELSWRDRRRLQRVFVLRDLLAVNAMANGEDVSPLPYPYYSRLAGNSLLAAAAPEIFVDLGLARRHQLDVHLKVGKTEEAAGMYFYMQKYADAPELLTAALMMAPYKEELRTVQATYDLRREAVSRKLGIVAQNWRSQPVGEATDMQPLIKQLDAEVYSLDEPADKLLACARQLAISAEVNPTSEESTNALFDLRDTWDELERMESYSDRLPDLAAVLKSQGITFVKEWKHFSSSHGYIGYGLVAAEIQAKGEDDESFFARPYLVCWLRDAAQKINELHGEERFELIVYPETKPGKGDDAHETLQRIAVGGNWRARGLRRWELTSAEGFASRVKGSLNTLPYLTDRLMTLQLADL